MLIMNYLEIHFILTSATESNKEIVTALVSHLEFESFMHDEVGVKAYILKSSYVENSLTGIFEILDFGVEYTIKEIEQENWNATWEENYFDPIVIGDQCIVRAPFHKGFEKLPYEIIIHPQMSFGTGHHETTSLMVEQILKTELEGKKVLDMGCGTGILAILCKMRKSGTTLGIDIDQWCYDNSLENAELNNVDIDIEIGDVSLLENRKFDIILANINRNVLLRDIKEYAKCLDAGSKLLLSGFYEHDLELIMKEASANGLKNVTNNFKNKWTVATFVKEM